MAQVAGLAQHVSLRRACDVLGVPRSSHYAARRPRTPRPRRPARPPRALTPDEKAQVRQTLYSQRFADQAARQVYATLLDDGQYVCSVASMYRILAENAQTGERRNQLRHRTYARPELVASAPNQVWTWDITRLRGPQPGVFYCLYVLLDLFSRYVVGWLIARQESAHHAAQLIGQSCARQAIVPGQLRMHSDRGAPMVAHGLAQLFEHLGLTASLARPRTPDDNPFSEAQFKTTKYHFTFPERFAGLPAARQWGQAFFSWYNDQHHHVNLGLLTPAVVHAGLASEFYARRQQVLTQAYLAHPERFVNGPPHPPALPGPTFINPPRQGEKASLATTDAP
jgi:putative transposase